MVAVGLWAALLGRPAIWLLPLVFPAVMAAGAIVGAQGVAVPFVEIGIVISVIALGAAVAFRVRTPIALSAALVGLFALFHGAAHGAELPADAPAMTYGLGFVAATLVLHLVGIGIATVAGRPVVTRAAGGAIAALGLVLLVLP
jgi:urease accessory protein